MSRIVDYTSMNSLETAILEICPNYQEDLNSNRFDIIATELSHPILNIVPFKEKSSLDLILIGNCPNIGGNGGYLAWHIYNNLDLYKYEDKSIFEIKELLKNKEIQEQLEFLYNLCQEFLIKPMVEIMLEISDDEHYNQSNMSKHLNLDKLEISNIHKGWICRELYMRLVSQGLMQKSNRGRYVYYKTISKNNYNPPDFILPNPEHSILHMKCLKKLEPILEKLNQDTNDKYETVCEYSYYLDGYDKPARADILIKKNGNLYGIIEADGKQHYEYLPHFHNPKNDRKNNEAGYETFLRLQEKDRKKDIASKNMCNGKDCLRIRYDTKVSDIEQQINAWIKV